MYRPIVIPPMRTANNVRSVIVAPEFTNVKLYNDGYTLTVSLHISEKVYDGLCQSELHEARPIQYRGRYYFHWSKTYLYDTKFCFAFAEAEIALRGMKVIIREQKVRILQDEIDYLKYGK